MPKMILATSFCNHPTVQPDKHLFEGYPGEDGFSPRERLAIIVGLAIGSWIAFAAPVLPFVL